MSSVCAHVSEDYPLVDPESWHKYVGSEKKPKVTLHLECPKDTRISDIKFASFGNPIGKCGSYNKGTCHDPNSISAVEKVEEIVYTSNSNCCLPVCYKNCSLLIAL